MSAQDYRFIRRSGLSASKIASLLGKSRQAVSKGIGGEEDYFSSADLVRISERVGDDFPDAVESVHQVVGDYFTELAEKLGRGGGAGAALGQAVAAAERLWLILPDYLTSYGEQPEAYNGLFSAIDVRRPLEVEGGALEVIVFCWKGRESIEMQFDPSWADQRQLAILECDVVDNMLLPMLIVDPHLKTGQSCYALAQRGFEPLAPGLARSRVLEFAGHVTKKLRASKTPGQDGLDNMMTTTPESLIQAGIQRL